MDLELQNRTVLVTGSHRGTGQVIARRFADEGARVLVHGFDESAARESAGSITGASAIWGDITTDDGADQVISQVAATTEHVDVLINNYGEAQRGKWTSADTEDWIRLYDINTLSVVRMIQGCMDRMPEGGRIVNLGTIGSTRPNRRT